MLLFPVIRTLLHIWVGTFQPALGPVQWNETKALVEPMGIFGRQPGDTISTVGLLVPDPMAGSILLYAGWEIDGQPDGAPNDGFLPDPRQLLRAVANDPTVAYSFWHPVAGAPSSLSH